MHNLWEFFKSRYCSRL